jgi:hypothetical protein
MTASSNSLRSLAAPENLKTLVSACQPTVQNSTWPSGLEGWSRHQRATAFTGICSNAASHWCGDPCRSPQFLPACQQILESCMDVAIFHKNDPAVRISRATRTGIGKESDSGIAWSQAMWKNHACPLDADRPHRLGTRRALGRLSRAAKLPARQKNHRPPVGRLHCSRQMRRRRG